MPEQILLTLLHTGSVQHIGAEPSGSRDNIWHVDACRFLGAKSSDACLLALHGLGYYKYFERSINVPVYSVLRSKGSTSAQSSTFACELQSSHACTNFLATGHRCSNLAAPRTHHANTMHRSTQQLW